MFLPFSHGAGSVFMNILYEPLLLNISCFSDFPKLLKHKTCSYVPNVTKFQKYNNAVLLAMQGCFNFTYVLFFKILHVLLSMFVFYLIFFTGNGELAGDVTNSFNHKVIYIL